MTVNSFIPPTKGDLRKLFPSEYYTWVNMRNRCHYPPAVGYARYGGRGIQVCKRWRAGIRNFLSDMGPKPSPAHTIERIDNNSDYCPENCRWATRKEQARNTRRNRMITIGNETHCLAEWSELCGIHQDLISTRISRGWSPERATTVRDGNKRIRGRLIAFRGESKTVREWAEQFGLYQAVINRRLKLGWTIEATLTTPIKKMPERS